MALGARSQDVVRAVVGLGARPLMVRLGVGLLGAVGAGYALRSNLFGMSPLDPYAYGAVTALLAAAALAALALPARRAIKIDPLVALRCE